MEATNDRARCGAQYIGNFEEMANRLACVAATVQGQALDDVAQRRLVALAQQVIAYGDTVRLILARRGQEGLGDIAEIICRGQVFARAVEAFAVHGEPVPDDLWQQYEAATNDLVRGEVVKAMEILQEHGLAMQELAEQPAAQERYWSTMADCVETLKAFVAKYGGLVGRLF
ncbi:hypothetical protein ASALC70_00034 [Alcanivorax sp. ALC70]|nr:hypothetical protein [Alcanivorax sp.]MBI56699.1 hypothetical protein [Alcanivorax sp.]UWN47861.1 hypothetical protein ASALC70_00034 [Alcanivorax sp. ALC70]|tara:strand:- start:213 stop:728 length:516 start_codon:yes stop_codon:yes gene_type:complete